MELVYLHRRVCTTGGTWIPVGAIMFITNTHRNYNGRLTWSVFYNGGGYEIVQGDPDIGLGWRTIKETRLLKLLYD